MIKRVLLAALIVMAFIVTQHQAYAQDFSGWTILLKIARNFTDSCTAEGHAEAECTEMFKNLGKK
jgi:alkyl hydroperoxide reductase subunit AhpC